MSYYDWSKHTPQSGVVPPTEEAGSWDDVIPSTDGSRPDWELRIWTPEVKRSCPKCGVIDWRMRWLRAGKVPGIADECLRVLCGKCGWWFYMETQEAAERRTKPQRKP